MHHADLHYCPRPPPPTPDEIDFFCVDLRTALSGVEARKPTSPTGAGAPAAEPAAPSSKYPDFIFPVESEETAVPAAPRKHPPSMKKKTPSPTHTRRDK